MPDGRLRQRTPETPENMPEFPPTEAKIGRKIPDFATPPEGVALSISAWEWK